ncbi:MAG: hypothetical protein OEM97_08990, partial [Acidimicrobiia bacterium]|nr:hypothetical protein [Acidimicrobiia bacterium]
MTHRAFSREAGIAAAPDLPGAGRQGTRFRHPRNLLVSVFVVGTLLGAGCTTTDETTAPPTTPPPPATATTSSTTVGTEAGFSLLAPDPVPGEVYFAPFPMSITLDGDLTDWEGIPTVTIPPTADVVIGSTSVEFAATADNEFLYLMGNITDSRIVTGLHGSDYWNEDSVEFYINGTGDPNLASYTEGVVQITVPPLNAGRAPGEIVLGGIQADSAEASVAVGETSDGYTVELAVPLKNRVWNIQREHANSIGFQVHLNSASETSRDLKVIWSTFDTGDTSYLNP